MQIHHRAHGPAAGLSANPVSPHNSTRTSVRGEASGRRGDNVEIVGNHANQLASLAAQLQDDPAIRADAVLQAQDRIGRGYYLTRAAAERTAAIFVGT